jgi:hypothetical protein
LIDPKQKYDSTDNSKDHSDRIEGESGLNSRNNDEVSKSDVMYRSQKVRAPATITPKK